MKKRILSKRLLLILISSFFIFSQNAFSSGYYVMDQSSVGMRTAFSSNVTGNGDASEVYFNPAAMSQYQCSAGSVNVAFIDVYARFNNRNSTDTHGNKLNGTSANGGGLEVVPSTYWVAPISEDFTAGFGFNAPYGFKVKYNDTWYGRYKADDTDLAIYSFTPALSYRVTDHLSLGANMGINYADATVSNSIDFGSIGERTLGEDRAHAMGLFAQQNDGHADLTADSWKPNWAIGGLYTYGQEERNRVGVVWKSKTAFDLNGHAKFTVPEEAQFLQYTGNFINTDVSSHLTLPEHITGGVKQFLTDKFALQGEIDWIRWSRFKELRFQYGSNQADSVEKEDWNDVFRYSIGGIYKITDDLEYSLGYMFDKSPVPSHRRSPRIPDNDRHLISTGLNYKLTQNLELGAGYTYIVVNDARITARDGVGNTLDGKYDLGIQVVGVGLTYRF